MITLSSLSTHHTAVVVLCGLLLLSMMFCSPATRRPISIVVLTVIAAWALWQWLGNPTKFLSSSGHIAAILGFIWAAMVWMLRHVHSERNKLTTHHPAILAGQFICLAACLFSVLVNVYLIVSQFGLAIIQNWSYTLIHHDEWYITDQSGMIDFAMIALACLVVIHITRSAYLLVPLIWVLWLATVWQCLLIPATLPSTNEFWVTPSGTPSFWLVALQWSCASILAATVAAQWHSYKSNRRKAWRLDIAYLLRPPRSWPGFHESALAWGAITLIAGCLLLVFPAPIQGFSGTLPSIACAVGSCISGIALLAVVHHRWEKTTAEVGMGLLILAICASVFVFLPREPEPLTRRFPLIFNALVLGMAISSFWFTWLARVWHQQLDGTRAWTTAGRLVPVACRNSLLACFLGAIFAIRMSSWPLVETVYIEDNSATRIACGVIAILALIGSAVWGYKTTGRPVFRSMILLTSFALMLFGFVRTMPLMGLAY